MLAMVEIHFNLQKSEVIKIRIFQRQAQDLFQRINSNNGVVQVQSVDLLKLDCEGGENSTSK